MGVVAALVKLFSIGAVILSPVLAILAEALLAEYVVRIRGVSRLSYGLTGLSVVMYTLVHPLWTQGLIFGTGIFRIYIETFRKLSDIMGVDPLHLVWVGVSYVCVHGIMGILSGLAAHGTARAVHRELQARREHSP